MCIYVYINKACFSNQVLSVSKNEKANFIQAILKLETLLYQNIFTSFYHILHLYSNLDSNKNKMVLAV